MNKPYSYFVKVEKLQAQRKGFKSTWQYHSNLAIKALQPLNKKAYQEHKKRANEAFQKMQECEKQLRELS